MRKVRPLHIIYMPYMMYAIVSIHDLSLGLGIITNVCFSGFMRLRCSPTETCTCRYYTPMFPPSPQSKRS